jgi:hypothetical protein
MAEGLCPTMSQIVLAKEILNIQDAAFAGIERTDAFIYFTAKRVELLDMREQLATDLFLIGVRQPGDLRDGLFECSDHDRSLAHPE